MKKSVEFPPPSQISRNSQLQRGQSELLSTPVPFKKVNSTPSNFSSFFTDQTVNTVSTSKFWDEIEGFPEHQKKGTRKTVAKGNTNTIAPADIMVTATDEYFNSHLVRVKKDRVIEERAENVQVTNDTAHSEPAANNTAVPSMNSSKPDPVATGRSSNNRVQSPLE